MPALALGPGWSLRICSQRWIGTAQCCAVQPSCCTGEDSTPKGPVVESGLCEHCCIDIENHREPSLQAVEPLGKHWERAQAVAVIVAVESFLPIGTERKALTHIQRPPAPPGRCTPLPLRI